MYKAFITWNLSTERKDGVVDEWASVYVVKNMKFVPTKGMNLCFTPEDIYCTWDEMEVQSVHANFSKIEPVEGCDFIIYLLSGKVYGNCIPVQSIDDWRLFISIDRWRILKSDAMKDYSEDRYNPEDVGIVKCHGRYCCLKPLELIVAKKLNPDGPDKLEFV